MRGVRLWNMVRTVGVGGRSTWLSLESERDGERGMGERGMGKGEMGKKNGRGRMEQKR